MDSAILAELQAIRALLSDVLDAQRAMVAALAGDGDEGPRHDLDGNLILPDRADTDEL